MLLKKYSYYIYKYLIIIFCFIFIFIRNAVVAYAQKVDSFYYIKLCFGGITATGQFDIITIFLWLVANIIILYSFSEIMREDCLINYVYVFTRLGKKRKWLFKKAIKLLVNLFFLFAILFFIAFIIGKTYGLEITINSKNISMLISIFALNLLSIFVLSFMQNFLSLKLGSMQSFLFTVLYYAFSIIFTLSVFNINKGLNLLLFLLIPTNQMYIWHTGCADNDLTVYIFGNALTGFKLIYSYIVLIAYAVVFYLIAHFIFEKLDLAEMIKEE